MEVITINTPVDIQKLFHRELNVILRGHCRGLKDHCRLLIRRNVLELMQLCQPWGRKFKVNSFVRREWDIHTLQINRKPPQWICKGEGKKVETEFRSVMRQEGTMIVQMNTNDIGTYIGRFQSKRLHISFIWTLPSTRAVICPYFNN